MRIIIPGDPISKIRHRLSTRHGFIRQYDPQDKLKKVFSSNLRESVENLWRVQERPHKIDIIFEMDAIIGSSKSESNLKAWGYSYPLKKDLDNMAKFVLDCGNEILWPDDRYIIELSCKKRFSQKPCTIIDIEIIPEMKMTKEHEIVFKTFSPNDIADFNREAQSIYFPDAICTLDDTRMYEKQLASAADLLIEFANKWTDKLKKIKGK